MSLLRSDVKRRMRRGWPIHAYIGPNGGGKTCAAVWDTLPSLMSGRPVLSTVRILDFEDPRPCDDPACESPDHATHMAAHPLWTPWTSWAQLLEVERCDVIADEVTGVASSRNSQSMPAVIANALVQLRRRDVVLRWTAPSWSRADLIIRECSQAATLCSGFLKVRVDESPVLVPAPEGVEDDVLAGSESSPAIAAPASALPPSRSWQHRRLFRWLTYDAQLVDELDAAKLRGTAHTKGMKPWAIDLHWGPGSPAFAAYDTFDAVSSIGHVSDSGRCMRCDGRRSAPACSCPDYQESRGRSRAAGGRGGSPRAGYATPADGEDLDPGAPALSVVSDRA